MVRHLHLYYLPMLTSFNPRTRDGATHIIKGLNKYITVSIHARVMVRQQGVRSDSRKNRFNPRTRDGATACAIEPGRRGEVSIHARVMVRPGEAI